MQNQFIFKIKVEKKTSTFIIFILKKFFFNQKKSQIYYWNCKFSILTGNFVWNVK